MMSMPTEIGTVLPNCPDIDLQDPHSRKRPSCVDAVVGGVPFRLTWRQGAFLSTDQMLAVLFRGNWRRRKAGRRL